MSEKSSAIYEELPGGTELLEWFGGTPHFGDAEIISLTLNREGASTLRILALRRADGVWRHAIVTFSLENITHLKLEDFSHQNVIGGLVLRRGPRQPDPRPDFRHAPPEPDYEIELEPGFGLQGLIRCRSLRIEIEGSGTGLAPDAETLNESRSRGSART